MVNHQIKTIMIGARTVELESQRLKEKQGVDSRGKVKNIERNDHVHQFVRFVCVCVCVYVGLSRK